MKTIQQKILVLATSLLFVSAIPTFAIEGLQIAVVSSNAVLTWPSLTDGSETFLVQYRSNLVASTWTTLADFLPESGSNTTSFVDTSNLVQFPVWSGGGTNSGGSGNPMPPGAGDTNSLSGGGTNLWPVSTGFYRVVRDGVHLWGLTNGMVVSNELVTPIEFAVGNITDQIVGVTFYDENNSPLIGASASGSGNAWTLVWNTTMSFNGDYDIYAELDFASNNPVVSNPVSVTVDNVISFPNYFSRVYGNQMWIYAQTIPDAAYELDIYDENTNYLGSFYDYADDDGLISFIWDLTDGEGNTFDDTNFTGVFTVDTSAPEVRSKALVKHLKPTFQTAGLSRKTLVRSGVHPQDSGSSASANQLWVKEGAWSPSDNWVVTYGQLTNDDTYNKAAIDMIVGGVGSPDDFGGMLGTLDSLGLNGNLSPGNNAEQGAVFTLQDENSRTNLLGYLANWRFENFYFFGHGNESTIGSYNGFTLTKDQIAFALGNVPLSYQMQHAADHPYRFVWIDACDTAAGNLCEAFGIPAMTVSTNFFAAAGVESRAFIGFTKPTGFSDSNSSLDPNGWPNRSSMISQFIQAWMSGYNLSDIINTAKSGTFGYGTPGYIPYQYKMNSSVVIYGAEDLTHNIRTRP